MGELLPTSETPKHDSEHFTRGPQGQSKIERYGLVNLVLELQQEGLKGVEIADRCNMDLRNRDDGRQYYEIKQDNVVRFIQKFNREHFKSFKERHKEEFERFEDPISMVHHVCQQLRVELDYIQERRKGDGSIGSMDKFITVMDQLTKAMDTMGNLYQKMQPSWTVALFRANLRSYINLMLAMPDLSDQNKKALLDMIQVTLLSDQFMNVVESQAKEVD